MRRKVRLTESDLHRIVRESVKNILEDTKAQRKKDPMAQWFKDFDDIQKHRDNMEYITKGGRKPNHWKKGEVNEGAITQEHEDKLRQAVGEYANQIKRMLDSMTMTGHTGVNYLRDIIGDAEWVEELWSAYFGMKEFAKTTEERRKEKEDLAAEPPGGWERFGY